MPAVLFVDARSVQCCVDTQGGGGRPPCMEGQVVCDGCCVQRFVVGQGPQSCTGGQVGSCILIINTYLQSLVVSGCFSARGCVFRWCR